MAKIIVQNTEITVLSHDDKDYISLTDMVNGKQSESRAADIIKNWIRTRYAIEFLGAWEMMHNLNFIMANSPQLECWQTYASHIDVVVKNIYYRQLFWFIANNILSLHSN